MCRKIFSILILFFYVKFVVATSTINIISAEYGSDCFMFPTYRNVTEIFVQGCNTLQSCEIPVNNTELGGDPVRGYFKQIKVRYQCVKQGTIERTRFVTADEGATVALNCIGSNTNVHYSDPNALAKKCRKYSTICTTAINCATTGGGLFLRESMSKLAQISASKLIEKKLLEEASKQLVEKGVKAVTQTALDNALGFGIGHMAGSMADSALNKNSRNFNANS